MTEGPFEGWIDVQHAVEAEQTTANKLLANGKDPIVVPGFEAAFSRAEALHYVAQLRNVVAHGSQLPNASAFGLAIDPGMTREAFDQKELDNLGSIAQTVTDLGAFTDEELAEADARLADQLERGILLDPRTVANL